MESLLTEIQVAENCISLLVLGDGDCGERGAALSCRVTLWLSPMPRPGS
jgi:hypothetical protein